MTTEEIYNVLMKNGVRISAEFADLIRRGYDSDAAQKFSDEIVEDMSRITEHGANYGFNGSMKDTIDLLADIALSLGKHNVTAKLPKLRARRDEAIARMNESGAKIVSADIPSGLNGDTGAFVLCVKADVTVTIGELKGGLLLGDGADVCGKIVRKDIGISLPSPAQAGLCGAADFKNVFPPRRSNTHKGSFGRAVILAGSAAYSGAPFLSAGAALRCGCGYTRLAVPADIFPYCVGKLPEAILTCAPAEEGRRPPRKRARKRPHPCAVL